MKGVNGWSVGPQPDDTQRYINRPYRQPSPGTWQMVNQPPVSSGAQEAGCHASIHLSTHTAPKLRISGLSPRRHLPDAGREKPENLAG